MKKITTARMLILSMLLISCLSLYCGNDNPMDSNVPDPTRLYLVGDNELSKTPATDPGVTQHFIYSSSDWTAVLSGDMVGTDCKFGLLFAVPPGQSLTARAEIIIKSGGVETVVTSKTFQVSSDTYTRFLEPVQVSDPECASGDILILRITKATNGSAGLGVMANTAAPNDSYIEVPGVDI